MTDQLPQSYHAHLYFDEVSKERAFALRSQISESFPGVEVGRFHEKPVGPHPIGSCQIAFEASLFGTFVPWLMVHRGDITVFLHAETGDDLVDHRDHALWLGTQMPIKLELFEA